MYSSDDIYLPSIPVNNSPADSQCQIDGCKFELFSERDISSFAKEFRLNQDGEVINSVTVDKLRPLISSVFNDIENIEILSNWQLQARIHQESKEPSNMSFKPLEYEQMLSLQREMIKKCDKKSGF